jgi:hypothetical protein
VMLAIAAALLLCRALEDGFRRGEAVLLVVIWLSPLINPPSLFRVGVVTPLLIALFIAIIVSRARASSIGSCQGIVCA